MSKYGKALGTYSKINKIKRSVEKIQEARVIAGEQQAKAMRKAQDTVLNKNLFDAVANTAVAGASYGMSKSKSVSPDTASKISAGLGAASEFASNFANRASVEETAGLSRSDFEDFYRNIEANPTEGAINAYSLQESLNAIQKQKQFNKVKDAIENNVYGLSIDEMSPYMNEVEWEKGVGYDFSNLPSITNFEIQKLKEIQGLIPANERAATSFDSEFDQDQVIDVFDERQKNKNKFGGFLG